MYELYIRKSNVSMVIVNITVVVSKVNFTFNIKLLYYTTCICIHLDKYQYSLWDSASLYKTVWVMLYNIVIVSHLHKLVTTLSL